MNDLEKRAREWLNKDYSDSYFNDNPNLTLAEIAQIVAEFASSVRRETLEEAAKICDEHYMNDNSAKYAAREIRALASPQEKK